MSRQCVLGGGGGKLYMQFRILIGFSRIWLEIKHFYKKLGELEMPTGTIVVFQYRHISEQSISLALR